MNDPRDKTRAEAVWNDRISPTLQGRYTINRSGIIECIANVGGAARAEGRNEGAAVLGGLIAMGEAIRTNAIRRRFLRAAQGAILAEYSSTFERMAEEP